MKRKKAAFFDRDGTIIDDVYYLSSIDQIVLIPHTLEIMKMCQKHGYQIFMVTNQSGVARGYFSYAVVEQVNAYLTNLLRMHDIKIIDTFYCSHHPDFTGICHCRKPATGMIDVAADLYTLDLATSLVFGDRDSDLQMGKTRGCRSFNVVDLLQCSYKQIEEYIFSNNADQRKEHS